jgi:uncharacterized membrane protein YgdD (TMEM256/DUF423 family)
MAGVRGRWPLLLAAFYGSTGVIAGAFGAHGLRLHYSPESLSIWETAARYQLLHALALLAIGLYLGDRPMTLWQRGAAIGWGVGTLIFSGSLYLLVLTGAGWLGAVTPIGGVGLILGWLAMAVFAGAEQ